LFRFGYRAGGVGIFGGGNHYLHNLFVSEVVQSAGVRFTADFPGCGFSGVMKVIFFFVVLFLLLY
jgi:hypothetical protein